MRAAHREAMHERRITAVDIGPEQLILELESNRADDQPVVLGGDEHAGCSLVPDAMLLELSFHPHRRAIELRHPVGGFGQRLDERTGIADGRLANDDRRQRTSANAKPSCPFALTVCIIVTSTRESFFSRSAKRRTPFTSALSLAASMTAPLRTTLSTTITAPRRDSFTAQSK